VLEARDVMDVLAQRPQAPADLREKSIQLAGRVLEADPALKGGRGEGRARELLESGAAVRAMEAIIHAQGPSPISEGIGELVHEVCARNAGTVVAMDCLQIAQIARLAGAPTNPGAGIDLLRKGGDHVRAGEPLYRIHGSEPSDFHFAVEAAAEDDGLRIEP
jgi:thymidine phosphorylase